MAGYPVFYGLSPGAILLLSQQCRLHAIAQLYFVRATMKTTWMCGLLPWPSFVTVRLGRIASAETPTRRLEV